MKGMYVNKMTQRENRERERERGDPFNIPFTFAFFQMKGMYVNAMTQREDRERKRERPFQHSFHFHFRSNERYVCQCNDSKGR